MKPDVKAFVVTAGIFWAAAIGITGIASLIWSGYGSAFLQMFASVYPGYDASGTIGDVIVGALYALVDGAIGGLIFVCIYNAFVRTTAISSAYRRPTQSQGDCHCLQGLAHHDQDIFDSG